MERRSDGVEIWRRNVHSTLVFSAGDPASLERVAGLLTGDASASVVRVPADTTWQVAHTLRDFCKSMSGLKVRTHSDGHQNAIAFNQSDPRIAAVVSCEKGAALLRIERHGVPVFLSSVNAMIDLDAPLSVPAFDIRREFLSALPAAMYVKWAFDGTCWEPPLTTACMVIDDPLLRPRYGFLDFRRLLDLMLAHKFATNIAFIPWNWRRSARKVVRLFRENPERLSLSVHGCDHTGGEFGIQDSERLAWRAKQAVIRMARHEALTGIRFDPVMVFPQGVFSRVAMKVLKRTGFIAVVNTEVVGNDPQPFKVSVADYWDVAVRNYSDFPIFTRRYPSHGIENFAFDILLGKPCLVVIHHDDCRDNCKPLMEFIDRLNSLNARLSWCDLGQVVRRSFRQREIARGLVELEMYGSELLVENSSNSTCRFQIHKREAEPGSIKQICAGSTPVEWHVTGDQVNFAIELGAGRELRRKNRIHRIAGRAASEARAFATEPRRW